MQVPFYVLIACLAGLILRIYYLICFLTKTDNYDYEYTSEVADSVAGDGEKLKAKLARGLRDKIAIALHTGQAELMFWLNRNNPYEEAPKRAVIKLRNTAVLKRGCDKVARSG